MMPDDGAMVPVMVPVTAQHQPAQKSDFLLPTCANWRNARAPTGITTLVRIGNIVPILTIAVTQMQVKGLVVDQQDDPLERVSCRGDVANLHIGPLHHHHMKHLHQLLLRKGLRLVGILRLP